MQQYYDFLFYRLKANGKAPTRAYHSASFFRHELWIFGGVFPQPDPKPDGSSNDIYVFSPIQENWYMPIVMGEKPAPRSGLVLLQSTSVVELDSCGLERESAGSHSAAVSVIRMPDKKC